MRIQIKIGDLKWLREWIFLILRQHPPRNMFFYRIVHNKGTDLLSTSLAWPAVAGWSKAETFSQLSSIYFAQPCSGHYLGFRLFRFHIFARKGVISAESNMQVLAPQELNQPIDHQPTCSAASAASQQLTVRSWPAKTCL